MKDEDEGLGDNRGASFRVRVEGRPTGDVKGVGGEALWPEEGSSVTKVVEVKPF